jgi:tRNA(Ile)-lysidine synthase
MFDRVAARVPVMAAPLCVAVSGGADSMALAVLLHRWSSRVGGPPVVALCVDHQLRVESAGEIDSVRTQLERFGVAVHAQKIVWANGRPAQAKLSEACRNERYRVLATMCTAVRAR